MILNLSGAHLGDVLMAMPVMRAGDVVISKHRIPELPVTWEPEQKGGIRADKFYKRGRQNTQAWLLATGRQPMRHQLHEARDRTQIVVAPSVSAQHKQWDKWPSLVQELTDAVIVTDEEPRHVWMETLATAHTVICPDTATVHMADALGVPKVIGLYGRMFDMFAPFWNPKYCISKESMRAIAVNDVLEKVDG